MQERQVRPAKSVLKVHLPQACLINALHANVKRPMFL